MPLAKVVWRLLLPYKGDALKTITTDNGSEFAQYEWITRMLNVPVFFAKSYSSWQKGAVKNENKLVRQYIPKGTDISSVTDAKIRIVRNKINARPRQKLNFYTPTEVFFKNIVVMLHLLVDSTATISHSPSRDISVSAFFRLRFFFTVNRSFRLEKSRFNMIPPPCVVREDFEK